MANTYKSLGQANPGPALTALYTVPAATNAIVWLTVANSETAANTCRVTHAPAGAADDADHRILYDFSIPANDTYIHPKPIFMAATDVLRVYGSDTNLTFTADGVEIT